MFAWNFHRRKLIDPSMSVTQAERDSGEATTAAVPVDVALVCRFFHAMRLLLLISLFRYAGGSWGSACGGCCRH